MKVIVSHDIDHITASEHYLKDLIMPKHLLRTKLEFLNGKISFTEVAERYMEIFRNRLNNIPALTEFNKSKGISNSFFIGVNNGIGLSYSKQLAATTANWLISKGCMVYLHGIEYQTTEKLLAEKGIFEREIGISAKGIRMHYVRMETDTLKNMASAGYMFDSTLHAFKDPFKVNTMWEFPFQVMDGWIIENGKRRQSRNLDEAKEATKKIIGEAQSKGLNYFGVDFHDRYFSKAFVTWMKWYEWLIEYLRSEGCTFTNFEDAIKELEPLMEKKFIV